jgi:hypothetical protein
MERVGIGVFMATPDFDVEDRAKKFELGPAFRFQQGDLTRVDSYLRNSLSFWVRRRGGRLDDYGAPVLPFGYIKYFALGATEELFRTELRELVGDAPQGDSFPQPRPAGFLGAFWRSHWGFKQLFAAASRDCMGRCNPPTSCREEGCFCNHLLRRCL